MSSICTSLLIQGHHHTTEKKIVKLIFTSPLHLKKKTEGLKSQNQLYTLEYDLPTFMTSVRISNERKTRHNYKWEMG